MELGKSFIEYTSWKSMFANLPAEQSQSLHISLFEYVESGKEPDFESSYGKDAGKVLYGIYDMMRGAIDANKARYLEISEKRSKSGKKGARARWGKDKEDTIAKDGKTWQMPTKDSKSCLNVNDNENDFDNDNVNDNNNANIQNWIESILSAYPEKKRQENARIEIEQRIEDGEEPEKLLHAAKMYALEMDGTGTYRIYPDNFYMRNGKYLSYKDMKPDEIKRRAQRQEPEKRKPKNRDIGFCNFEQREYDYKALEAQLLGGPLPGAPEDQHVPEGKSAGRDQETSCSGDPEGQHVPEGRSSGRGQEASCSGDPEGQ